MGFCLHDIEKYSARPVLYQKQQLPRLRRRSRHEAFFTASSLNQQIIPDTSDLRGSSLFFSATAATRRWNAKHKLCKVATRRGNKSYEALWWEKQQMMRGNGSGRWKRGSWEKKVSGCKSRKVEGKKIETVGRLEPVAPWASESWTSKLAGNCCFEDVRDLKWKLTIFLFTPLRGRLADLNTVWFDTSDIPAGSRSARLR